MKNRQFSKALWLQLKSLIPGIIIAALVFGPSKMTLTSKLGASYGYSLVWIVPVAIFFMAVFTNMGSRIGMCNTQSLLQLVQHRFGRWIQLVVGIGIFMVSASFQAGNAIGVGIAIAEPTGTSSVIWIIVFTGLSISLLFFRSFYKLLERLMLALVLLMLASFSVTFFLADPDLGELVQGFEPHIPSGSLYLIIAFMASCFSVVGAFYQSYLVQERKKLMGNTTFQDRSLLGILVLGIMSLVVIICAASVLYPKQIPVHNALDMARVLEPLFGPYAAGVFLSGLFAASFSSLVGNATVGGSLLGEALGYGTGLESLGNRVCIAFVMIIGATIAILFGSTPLQLIVLAQSITIFLVPIIGFVMFVIANDEHIMGNRKNTLLQQWVGVIGLLLLTTLAVFNFYDMFIK